MKLLLLLVLIWGSAMNGYAQIDSLNVSVQKTNSIIYWEGYIGAGGGGLLLGTSANYQWKKSLFTARFTGITKIETDIIHPLVPFPIFKLKEQYNEPALLYGYRYINNGLSLSASAGISYNHRKKYSSTDNLDLEHYDYVGMPFELNLKWFNSTKRRFRILYIIPVSRPTGFSRSIGFKVIGNVSRFSYIGAGLTYGLGYHKLY